MSDQKTYGLSHDFEAIVVGMNCTRPAFWGRIGEHVDSDMLEDSVHKLVQRACMSLAVDHGRPPDTPAVVTQRIARWHEEGSVSYDAMEKAEAFILDAMEDSRHYNEETIVAELKPILTRSMEREALETGLDAFGKKRSLDSVSVMLDRAYRIGNVNTATGTVVAAAAVDEILQLKKFTRLGTGIPELDSALNGGLPRGCFGVVIGPQKAGKSMFLNHVAAHAMVNGLTVAYASLEVSRQHALARLVANLIDLPSDHIIEDLLANDARERLEHLVREGLLPLSVVDYFAPDVTTVQDIKDWVHRKEDEHKKLIDVVCTDYIQLIGTGTKDAVHVQQKKTAQAHRAWAAEENKWVWTGAQPKGAKDRGGKKATIGMDDVADGLYITRTSDLGISLNPRDEGMMYHVAGFRHGEGGQDVGPFPTYFAYGRVSHVARQGWPFWTPEMVQDFGEL